MDSLCINKKDMEKFGGDLKLALIYIYLDRNTAHGKKVLSASEADILSGLFGILGVPRFRLAVKEMKKMGYLKTRRTFGGKPNWIFNPNGAGVDESKKGSN